MKRKFFLFFKGNENIKKGSKKLFVCEKFLSFECPRLLTFPSSRFSFSISGIIKTYPKSKFFFK